MGTGVTVNYGAQSLEEAMELIMPLLPILIPLSLIQFALMVIALVHAVKAKEFKVGNKIMWVVLILLVDIIGPVLYFTIGRGTNLDEQGEDEHE
ncbi:MAG: PLD nuclease N-terminal domain-containing protein [Oscillospiraceae bacterium]|nr:PLD nuclease N-terminal domain-containing protein [Oscillospiraceae bacterium]